MQQELIKFKGKQKDHRVDYLFEFPSVKRWLSQLKEGPGRRINIYIFHRYMKFVKDHSGFKTPEDLIESALNSTLRQLQQHADILKDYLDAMQIVGDSTRSKHRDVVMSFYKNNSVKAVPWVKFKPRNEDISIEDASEESENYVELMRTVCRAKCSRLQLAVLLTAYQSFMDDSTIAYVFNYFGYAQLVKHFGTTDWTKWDENKVPVRIDIVRPKSNLKGWTCLHHDAVVALKEWLSVRFNLVGKEIRLYPSPNTKMIPRSDPIFIVGKDDHAIPPPYVSYVFRELGKKAGVNVYTGPRPSKTQGALIRYAFSSHQVRDSARSLAHVLKIGEEVEFFITHKTDRHHYDQSPWKDPAYFLEAYDKLSPWLNVLSADPEKVKLREELQQKTKEFSEKENSWYIEARKLRDEMDKMKLVRKLERQYDMEKDRVKKDELARRLLELTSE